MSTEESQREQQANAGSNGEERGRLTRPALSDMLQGIIMTHWPVSAIDHSMSFESSDEANQASNDLQDLANLPEEPEGD